MHNTGRVKYFISSNDTLRSEIKFFTCKMFILCFDWFLMKKLSIEDFNTQKTCFLSLSVSVFKNDWGTFHQYICGFHLDIGDSRTNMSCWHQFITFDHPEYSWKIARWTLNTNQSYHICIQIKFLPPPPKKIINGMIKYNNQLQTTKCNYFMKQTDDTFIIFFNFSTQTFKMIFYNIKITEC